MHTCTRGWPKPKSSGLNQEPTRKKASRLGTRFEEFSSSWYPVRYPFSDFLVPPGTSGLKFLVQPWSSCFLQELLGFYQEVFWVMGQFSNKRNEPGSRISGYHPKVKSHEFFCRGYPLYLRSFSNMCIITPPTTAQPPAQLRKMRENKILFHILQGV